MGKRRPVGAFGFFLLLVQALGGAARPSEDGWVDAESAEQGFEVRDASALGLMALGMGIVLGAALMFASLYGMFRHVRSWQSAAALREFPPSAPSSLTRLRTLPPEPRLQRDPQADFERFHAAQMRELNVYRWVDKGRGIARIPIDRAMEILSSGH